MNLNLYEFLKKMDMQSADDYQIVVYDGCNIAMQFLYVNVDYLSCNVWMKNYIVDDFDISMERGTLSVWCKKKEGE